MAISDWKTDSDESTCLGAAALELDEECSGAWHTLTPKGELDLASAPLLDATLRRICTDRAEGLTVDLRQLTFMDSTGLRAVLLAKELCARHDCELLLLPGPPQIQRLFEVTGLLDLLPFRPTT